LPTPVGSVGDSSSTPMLVALVLLGDKVFAKNLRLVYLAEDEAYSAAVAAYKQNLISEAAAVDCLSRASAGRACRWQEQTAMPCCTAWHRSVLHCSRPTRT
jgi:hypothetical protein